MTYGFSLGKMSLKLREVVNQDHKNTQKNKKNKKTKCLNKYGSIVGHGRYDRFYLASDEEVRVEGKETRTTREIRVQKKRDRRVVKTYWFRMGRNL